MYNILGTCDRCGRIGRYGSTRYRLCPLCNNRRIANKKAMQKHKNKMFNKIKGNRLSTPVVSEPSTPVVISRVRMKGYRRDIEKGKIDSYGFDSELDMFRHVWDNVPHISYISGLYLPYFNVSCFAHVLSKGKYPSYRLNPSNIVLLTPHEHNLYDKGSMLQIESYPADWKALYRLRDMLLKEYKKKDSI